MDFDGVGSTVEVVDGVGDGSIVLVGSTETDGSGGEATVTFTIGESIFVPLSAFWILIFNSFDPLAVSVSKRAFRVVVAFPSESVEKSGMLTHEAFCCSQDEFHVSTSVKPSPPNAFM